MLILGFGTLGVSLRRRRAKRAAAVAKTVAAGTLWSGAAALEAGNVATDVAAIAAIKATAVSTAGKVLLCVCPAALVGGAVVTVPPIRSAVHAATVTTDDVALAPTIAAPCPEPVPVTLPQAAAADPSLTAAAAPAAATPAAPTT